MMQQQQQSKQSPRDLVAAQSASSVTFGAEKEEEVQISGVPTPSRTEGDSSSPPSDCGSMRIHSHGANYVGSAHWAAVLDSVSDLKGRYEMEEEARMMAAAEPSQHDSPGPRLLYEPVQITKAGIIASLPARPIVDRLVSRYFNAMGQAPGIST